ncbi:MAG: hypothetical protein A2Y63_00155 [Candidatus Riflebacteria bacterium RBG_13_59_9]|jgi:hypothetical protein|nr:MAG: hypothetical protein A2Y63_00155 [Candidatus Riflebacteria bacterium RBG_13_59_9]
MTLQVALLVVGAIAIAAGLVLMMRREGNRNLSAIAVSGNADDLEFNELEFFALAADLPEEYSRYLSPDQGRNLVIPGRNRRVGDLRVGVTPYVFRIQIGDHTQFDFRTPYEAIEFIADVLGDHIGFEIGEGEASQFRVDDELEMGDLPDHLEVWSGAPFRRPGGHRELPDGR